MESTPHRFEALKNVGTLKSWKCCHVSPQKVPREQQHSQGLAGCLGYDFEICCEMPRNEYITYHHIFTSSPHDSTTFSHLHIVTRWTFMAQPEPPLGRPRHDPSAFTGRGLGAFTAASTSGWPTSGHQSGPAPAKAGLFRLPVATPCQRR